MRKWYVCKTEALRMQDSGPNVRSGRWAHPLQEPLFLATRQLQKLPERRGGFAHCVETRLRNVACIYAPSQGPGNLHDARFAPEDHQSIQKLCTASST